MRQRLYTLVQKAAPGDRLSRAYDIFIVAVAFISVTPLMIKGTHPVFDAIDMVTVYILFADYIFRWATHDYTSEKKGSGAFLRYPFTLFAIVDLLSLLPSLGLLGPGFRVLRMLRIFVIFHYSDNFRYIAHVFRKEKRTLVSVLVIALFYIFVSALIMFSYEPDTFHSFFDALYWATTALTTVGYGDVYPISAIGKLISMVSSLFGIAVIALPAGIVTAGFVDEINKNTAEKQQQKLVERLEPTPAKGPLFHITPRVKRYALVMTIGIAMNLGLNALAQALNLPVWLDMTGTAFAAMALEPTAGLVVGLANNMLLAILEYGPSSLMYYAVSAAVALLAGLCLFKDGKFSPRRVLPTLLLIVLSTALLSASVDIWVTRAGAPGTPWENFFYGMAGLYGVPHIPAFYLSELLVKLLDTIASAAVVGLAYAALPFKRSRN